MVCLQTQQRQQQQAWRAGPTLCSSLPAARSLLLMLLSRPLLQQQQVQHRCWLPMHLRCLLCQLASLAFSCKMGMLPWQLWQLSAQQQQQVVQVGLHGVVLLLLLVVLEWVA